MPGEGVNWLESSCGLEVEFLSSVIEKGSIRNEKKEKGMKSKKGRK